MGKFKDNKTRYYLSVQGLLDWPYHLSESSISRGLKYTRQNDSWDCGPNSSARALDMWSKHCRVFSYEDFKSHCPKSFGEPQTTGGKVAFNALNIFTFGLSALVTKAFIPDVGPTPGELADYISERMSGIGRGIYTGRQSFSTIMDYIKDDLRANDPVVALIAWKPTKMHYINVVGVSDQEDVAILDTNNDLYFYTRSDFEYLLDCSSYIPHQMFLDDYNIIRFEKF